MSRRLLTCGEYAVLVELDGLEEVLALDAAVRAMVEAGDAVFEDVIDVVPAARTLLLIVRDGADIMPVRRAVQSLSGRGSAGASRTPRVGVQPEVVEIRVRYDGPDLEEVALLTGLTPKEVVTAHTVTPWRVAFAGFAPGFSYLYGGDPRLRVPRRSEPRTSVLAGSVGLAGEFSAVYPRSSPGGWQLLGRTDVVLWDVDRQPPALLQPGSVVHFVDLDADPAGE
jgi:KipI family sensor histidine kinase inhibitor